jgi:hypothetical protein
MFRALVIAIVAALAAGCVSTPNTKALITPIGGIGYHTFAPQRDPNRMPPPDANSVARIAANQQACALDEHCARNQ